MVEQRPLGRPGIQVSVLGFGGSEIGYSPVSMDTLDRLLGNAMDTGITVIDTAECYSNSEEAIGRALAGRRDRFYLITKCGHSRGFDLTDWTPRLLEQSIDRSLQRLRTDHIDVLLLHSCSEQILRQDEVIAALHQARTAGKVRFIGYRGDSQPALFAVKSGHFDVLMTSINIADQEAIELTLPLARERGMGVIAKRPLANVAWRPTVAPGGAHRSTFWPAGYVDPYRERLRQLDYPFLQGEARDAVSIALRFTLSCEAVSTAIIGTVNPERLPQDAELLAAGPLGQEQIAAIRARWRSIAGPSWVGLT
jgi:aryl-alcohol dehydrogenase-like predicted oxidoreductase